MFDDTPGGDDGGLAGVLALVALVLLPVLVQLGILTVHLYRGDIAMQLSKRSVQPEILQDVGHHFMAFKLKMLLKVFRAGAYLLALWSTATGIYALANPAWSNSPGIVYRNTYSYAYYLPHLVLLELLKVAHGKDKHKSRSWTMGRLLELNYGYAMLFFLVQQHMTEFPQSLRVALNIQRLIASVAYQNPLQTFVWNFVIFVSYMTHLSLLDLLDSNSAVIEATWFLLIIFSTHFGTVVLWDTAIDAVEANAAREEQSALEEILNATCDAVVKLDANLTIVKEDAKLSAMLMGQKAKKGSSMQKALDSPEDWEAFRSAVMIAHTAAESRPRVAQAFLVSLRDMIGNRIEVQIFHARLKKPDGETSYLIGICERGDPVSQARVEGERARLREEQLSPPAVAQEYDKKQIAEWLELRQETAQLRQLQQGEHELLSPKEKLAITPAAGQEPRATIRGTAPDLEPQALAGPCESSHSLQSIDETGSVSAPLRSLQRHMELVWTQEVEDGHEMEPTSQEAMEFAIVNAASFWNFEQPRKACCYYHSVGRVCRKLCRGMDQKRCKHMIPNRLRYQCDCCGLMQQTPGERCGYCQQLHMMAAEAERRQVTTASL